MADDYDYVAEGGDDEIHYDGENYDEYPNQAEDNGGLDFESMLYEAEGKFIK